MTGGQQGPEVELLAQDRGDLSGAALGQLLECSAPVSHLICWQSSAVGQCVAWWHILCQPTPQVPVTGVSALSTQGIFAKCHQCCHPKKLVDPFPASCFPHGSLVSHPEVLLSPLGAGHHLRFHHSSSFLPHKVLQGAGNNLCCTNLPSTGQGEELSWFP